MAESWQQRLNKRRKKGPSKFEEERGPNTGAWEKTNFPLRRYQGFQTGVSDWWHSKTNWKGPY